MKVVYALRKDKITPSATLSNSYFKAKKVCVDVYMLLVSTFCTNWVCRMHGIMRFHVRSPSYRSFLRA